MKLPSTIKISNSGKYNGIYHLTITYIGEDKYNIVYFNKVSSFAILDITVHTDNLDSIVEYISQSISESNQINDYQMLESVELLLKKIQEEV